MIILETFDFVCEDWEHQFRHVDFVSQAIRRLKVFILNNFVNFAVDTENKMNKLSDSSLHF